MLVEKGGVYVDDIFDNRAVQNAVSQIQKPISNVYNKVNSYIANNAYARALGIKADEFMNYIGDTVEYTDEGLEELFNSYLQTKADEKINKSVW